MTSLAVVEVQAYPDVWKPISKLEARTDLVEKHTYGINYREIAEIVASGNPVKVSLDYVSEGALRQGIAYHASYMGFLVSCNLTKDRRHIIVSKGYKQHGNSNRNRFYRGS